METTESHPSKCCYCGAFAIADGAAAPESVAGVAFAVVSVATDVVVVAAEPSLAVETEGVLVEEKY